MAPPTAMARAGESHQARYGSSPFPPDPRPASVGGPGFFTFPAGAPSIVPYNRPMIRTARAPRLPCLRPALACVLVACVVPLMAHARGQERLRSAPRGVNGTPASLAMDVAPGVPVIEGRIGEKTLRLIVDTGATW